MKPTLAVCCAFVLLALAGLACNSTGPATPAPNYAGPGYLWYDSNHNVNVPVFAPIHQTPPGDAEQLRLWRDRGEVCVVAPGTRVGPGSSPKPLGGWAIEVLEGPCRGYAGWVDFAAWHNRLP